MTEKILLKIGVLAYIAGIFLTIITELLHPHMQPPSDSLKAFTEYAHSTDWQAVHVAQFFGVMLLMHGFIALYKYLKKDEGYCAAFAWLGLAAAIVTMSIFALLQAIDGFTLKFVIDKWMDASAAQKDTAFRAAEAIRWIEVSFNGYFRILLGVTLLFYGLAVSTGKLFPKWPGIIGILAGIAVFIQGVLIGSYGFSPKINTWGTSALVLELLWVIVMSILMWRRSTTPSISKKK